jgi:uncharacterized iron-regulated membrane protein
VSLNRVDRRVHHWTSAVVALPLLVIISTGILLQLKKQWAWVQPPEQRGTGSAPAVELEEVLAAVRGVPGLGVDGWDDVNRLDLRPARGLAKVWLMNGWEVQVDLGTGRVLQSAYRRSDLLESIHDGSFFGGDATKLGLFLPVGVALLLLWVTGLWLFIYPFVLRRRRARIVAELAATAASRPAE